MAFIQWLGSHVFDLMGVVGIIGGLSFTAVNFRMDARARRVSNLLAVTGHHHEIWSQLYERPELARVLRADVNIEKEPMGIAEEIFIRSLILHLESTFRACLYGTYRQPDGLVRDVEQFFSLPLPRAVWKNIREFQDKDFVRFIERSDDSK